MKPINLDRRTFVKASAALGALSIAGAGAVAKPATLAVAAEYPEQRHGQPAEATVDAKTGKCPSMKTWSCATARAWAATAAAAIA